MDGANIFHTGELPRMREILDEAFALLGEDIAFAHAKDLDRDGEAGHLAAGKGLLDYDQYLSLLNDINPDIPIVLHGPQRSRGGRVRRLPAWKDRSHQYVRRENHLLRRLIIAEVRYQSPSPIGQYRRPNF